MTLWVSKTGPARSFLLFLEGLEVSKKGTPRGRSYDIFPRLPIGPYPSIFQGMPSFFTLGRIPRGVDWWSATPRDGGKLLG